MDFTLRPARAEDAPLLRRLFEDARGADFAHLDASMRSMILDLQWRAAEADRRARFPQASDHLVEVGGAPVGRLLVFRGPAETHVVDVALAADHRGRGLGGALVRALCAEGRPVTLAVAEDNPAARLYARLGFVETGRTPPYRLLRWLPGGHAGVPSN